MTRTLLVTVVSAVLAAATGAHPHAYVDQQVQLSVGLDRAEVTALIVPSASDGSAIFDHVDADADGAVSDDEARTLADAVLADLRLEVDGQAVALSAAATVALPEDIRAGTGAITVEASAPVALVAGAPHLVTFEAAFDDFAHEWFVQPFYHPDLVQAFGTPGLERSADGSGVTITLGP